MLHYELNTETFIIVLLPYTSIHSTCMCSEVHKVETKASYLYSRRCLYFRLREICVRITGEWFCRRAI